MKRKEVIVTRTVRIMYDEYGNEPISIPDTKNSTKINPEEVESDTEYWERISNINTGVVDSFGNREENIVREQERASTFDVISKELGLIDVHRREGREIMKDIDLEQFTAPRVGIYLISFCVAANLVNRDPIPRTYHPTRLEENNDKLFQEVKLKYDFDEDLINSNIQKLSNICSC